ncbi:hypothetical protein BRD06_02830 [Halobacteriales archaeon QS_9_67_15]|nr:MAG: hypothetical protein BRD06_02830 [Halobacteriales archaeon QS_9_67_15]
MDQDEFGDRDNANDQDDRHTDTTDATGSGTEQTSPDGGDPDATTEAGSAAEPGIVDRAALDAVESTVAALEDRLASIESQVTGDADPAGESAETGANGGATAALSAELTHKVAHACMESDRLTEDEELAVLRALMQCDD